jgi:hypothetical protein
VVQSNKAVFFMLGRLRVRVGSLNRRREKARRRARAVSRRLPDKFSACGSALGLSEVYSTALSCLSLDADSPPRALLGAFRNLRRKR